MWPIRGILLPFINKPHLCITVVHDLESLQENDFYSSSSCQIQMLFIDFVEHTWKTKLHLTCLALFGSFYRNWKRNFKWQLRTPEARLSFIEWFGLKGPYRSCSSNTPAMGRDTFHQTRFLKAPSNLAFNISREGTAIASLGNLCQVSLG